MASTKEETISKSDAEKAGWDFVHEQAQSETVVADGLIQVSPALYRAERKMNGTMQQAQGTSEEEVLQAITFIEDKAVTTPADGPALFDVSGLPVSEEFNDELLKTVYTDEGTFTEAEWSNRHRNDTIVTGDGQTIFSGLAEDGNQKTIEAMDEALQARSAAQLEAAQEEAAEEPLASEQFTYDTADAVDAPGISAGGTILAPKGIESVAEAAGAMNEASQKAENERVLAAQKAADEAPSGAVGSTEGPTLAAQIDAEKRRTDAILAERDKQAPEAKRSDEGEAKQTEAGVKAATSEEPNATPAAVEAAKEENIDLNEVKGTGEGGKITKADVEAAAGK